MKKHLTLFLFIFTTLSLQAQWTEVELLNFRLLGTATCFEDKIYISGGFIDTIGLPFGLKPLHIYDTNTGEWVEEEMPDGYLSVISSAPFIFDDKIYYSGGVMTTDSNIDIYDPNEGTWSVEEMALKKTSAFAGAAGKKLLFAGGVGDSPTNTESIDVVEIWDTETDEWDFVPLSQRRHQGATVTYGNKIFFAGGLIDTIPSNRIDIYDADTDTWSIDSLSVARFDLTAATVGDKIIFAGGNDRDSTYSSDVVDIFDMKTEQKSTAKLSIPRILAQPAVIGSKAYFTNGGEATESLTVLGTTSQESVVDVYDADTDTWEVLNTVTPRADHFACGCNGKLYIGGGVNEAAVGGLLTNMEIYTPETTSSKDISLVGNISVFPNPVNDRLMIQSTDISGNGIEYVRIFDLSGKLVFEKQFSEESSVELQLSFLPKGIYTSKITTDNGIALRKMVKN